jgi:hypothetical protein
MAKSLPLLLKKSSTCMRAAQRSGTRHAREHKRTTHLDVFEILGVAQVFVGNDRISSAHRTSPQDDQRMFAKARTDMRIALNSLLVLYEILGTFVDVSSVGRSGRQLERGAMEESVKAMRTRLS